MELGGNFRQVFGFKGLIGKVFRNKDLAEKYFTSVPNRKRVTTAQVLFRLSRSTGNGFWAASKSVSGDGHTSALADQSSFSGMASGMSVMVVTGWM
jgi:hypothetical protein